MTNTNAVSTSQSGYNDQIVANVTGLYLQLNQENNQTTLIDQLSHHNGACVFTKSQYDQLLQLLHKSNQTNVSVNMIKTSDYVVTLQVQVRLRPCQ